MCSVRGHELPIETQLYEYKMCQARHSRNDARDHVSRLEPHAGAEGPEAWGAACAICPERSRWLQGQLDCVTCPLQSRDPLGFASLN